ncbi:MAG: hypothetical protein ACP5OZ_00055 [Candidatus Woesearchaeota archaeon]
MPDKNSYKYKTDIILGGELKLSKVERLNAEDKDKLTKGRLENILHEKGFYGYLNFW